MSSKEENENSKKPFPREVKPYLPIDFQRTDSLDFTPSIDNGDDPLGNMILPCRLYLQESMPAK
jgi:hypothetical protein